MKRIKLDQIGYMEAEKKLAVFPGVEHCSFFVLNVSTNVVVLEGKTGEKMFHEPSNEWVSIADLSKVTSPGMYCVFSDDMEPSFPFSIGNGVYFPVMIQLIRMFYLQRCGMRLHKSYAHEFSHACCHATPALIYGTNQTKDVTGGWHDAGDYGRYVVAGAVTVAGLLLSWQENKSVFDRSYEIENTTGLPDFLAEVRYEIEWMLKMQDEETKGVYHKVTCASFPGFVMPEKETEQLILSPISAAATADFAASLALAYEVYKPYDKSFAQTCLNAAKSAYDALKEMPSTDGFHNPEGIVTGEYADRCDIDERYWACAQLYKATGESTYHEDFKALTSKEILHGYGWTDVGSFGNHAYLTCEYSVEKELYANIKSDVIRYAQDFVTKSQSDAYHTSLGMSYVWGSNMEVANNAIALCDAYRYKKDKVFIDMAREQLHYLFGKNPMDMCYVTGAGSNAPIHPHHRPSKAMNMAMPGMLVGGPDMGLHDKAAMAALKGQSPANCYIDDLESYSTNEITIYWNSPLIYLLALLIPKIE